MTGTTIDTDDRPTAARFGSRYAVAVLSILCFVYVLNFLDRQLLSILAKPIQDDLGISNTQLGRLGGLYFALFYCTISIPSRGWPTAPIACAC